MEPSAVVLGYLESLFHVKYACEKQLYLETNCEPVEGQESTREAAPKMNLLGKRAIADEMLALSYKSAPSHFTLPFASPFALGHRQACLRGAATFRGHGRHNFAAGRFHSDVALGAGASVTHKILGHKKLPVPFVVSTRRPYRA